MTGEMIYFLTIGMILGLSAGLAPGPLLTLVITETLQHDIKAGVKVALAPIITDLPIIIITFFILAKLSDFHGILGLISLSGGFFMLFLGYESMRAKGLEVTIHPKQPASLTKGVFANALNPHPYLFWMSIGAPTMSKAMSVHIVAPFVFLCSFYTFLVGSKILVAVLVGKSKSFLHGKAYTYTLRCLGLALCVLAFVLFHDGLKLLGFI
jgi:threonine/homoserine/homoserine lactone efflux protein